MLRVKSTPYLYRVGARMTTEDLIKEITDKNPQLSEAEILEKLETERRKTSGLFGDETLLRLIAARFGVQVQQNTLHNSSVLSSSRLIAGLNDVTVAGRLIAVFPAKTFQGAEKSGKFATLMIADDDGILRAVLWNEKAELVEKGELRVNQAVRLLHGYTRADRYGKVELHLGGKSQIQFEEHQTAVDYPQLDRFTTKIKVLTAASGNVHVCGTVKSISGKTCFLRSDQSDGMVIRITLADDSGQIAAVFWNEKVAEAERARENARLFLLNARVKENQGILELHVDSNTAVNILED